MFKELLIDELNFIFDNKYATSKHISMLVLDNNTEFPYALQNKFWDEYRNFIIIPNNIDVLNT